MRGDTLPIMLLRKRLVPRVSMRKTLRHADHVERDVTSVTRLIKRRLCHGPL